MKLLDAGPGESFLLSGPGLTPVFRLAGPAPDFTTVYMLLVPAAKRTHGLSALTQSHRDAGLLLNRPYNQRAVARGPATR